MKIHTSKVDNWYRVIVLIVALMPFGFGLIENMLIWPAVIICGGTAAFMIGLYMATKYAITDDELTIFAGLYKVHIPRNSISSITESNNALASPAFSLDRLEIKYENNKSILVSPKDKAAFLADLDLSLS